MYKQNFRVACFLLFNQIKWLFCPIGNFHLILLWANIFGSFLGKKRFNSVQSIEKLISWFYSFIQSMFAKNWFCYKNECLSYGFYHEYNLPLVPFSNLLTKKFFVVIWLKVFLYLVRLLQLFVFNATFQFSISLYCRLLSVLID